MNQNKKVNALKDIMPQNLKGTSFTSKKLKRTWKQRTRLFLWYVIVMGVCFTGFTITLLAQNSPIEAVKTVIVEKLPEPLEMTIQEHICNATNGENCEILINLAKCESSLNKDAYHINTNGTVDLGAFQINSVHYEKEDMSAVCALDVYCSARWSNEQIKAGRGHIWVCWDKI